MDPKITDTIDMPWRPAGVPAAARKRPVAAARQRTRCDQSRGPADGGAPEGSGGHRRRGRKRLAADLGRRQASARHRPRAVPARLLQRRHAERPLRPHSSARRGPQHRARPVEIRVANHYWLTGSFIHGTGEGHAEAPDIDVRVQSDASTETIKALVAAAMDASPAIAFLRTPLSGNTFALYINGRRRKVEGVANSPSADAGDPYRTLCARAATARPQRAPRPDRKDRPRGAGHARAGLGDGHQQAHPQHPRRGQVARPATGCTRPTPGSACRGPAISGW